MIVPIGQGIRYGIGDLPWLVLPCSQAERRYLAAGVELGTGPLSLRTACFIAALTAGFQRNPHSLVAQEVGLPLWNELRTVNTQSHT
jgi:hypothetical protein